MSVSNHFAVGDCVQIWDTKFGGTVDELACHGEIGLIIEQTRRDQFVVAFSNCKKATVHADWIQYPSVFLTTGQLLDSQ
jgi:hypothetical protein